MRLQSRLSGSFWAYRSLGIILLCLVLSSGCALFPQPAPAPALATPSATLESKPVCLDPGCLAPDFTLKTTTGEAMTLYQLRGHPVLINFWATWCGPCKTEMPDLQAVYDSYRGDGLVILGINEGEIDKQVTAFAQMYDLSFPMLLDADSQVGTTYNVKAIPVSYFVDSDGTIRDVHVGNLTEAEITEIVSAQLAAGKAAALGTPAGTTGRSTPAPRPSAEVTATAETGPGVELQGCVTSAGLNVRDRPGMDGAIADWLRNGKCYSFDGRTPANDWLRLADAVSLEGGRLWVSADYIALKGDILTLPEVK